MNTTSPTACPAWKKLEAHAESWRGTRLAELFAGDMARARSMRAEAPGLRLDYSRQRVGALTLKLLAQLATERGFDEWRAALFAGAPINITQQLPVRHTALRAGTTAPREVRDALVQMGALAAQLRSGELRGATGRPFTSLVNLGIGGSDLGSRLIVDALDDFRDDRIAIDFVASVDPLELDRVLRRSDPERTLFVVASKTFTTQETLANARAAKQWLTQQLPEDSDLTQHFIGVTVNSAAARTFGTFEVLPLWDWVGGRFSVWSPIGFAPMVAIGPERFGEFLAGAADIDRHFTETPLELNLPVLMALCGVWNVNFLGAHTHAILPYAHALRLLPAFLQQLEMESNGKRVDREGREIAYATAPVIWGAEGSIGQHSFHQLLHHGTQIVPADFITIESASGDHDRHAILAAQATAQAEVFAHGRRDPSLPAHRQYPGNRPSNTLTLEKLDARQLGRLLALYEHKVFVQGVIWNVNSFDQWGVELGKQLAQDILSKKR